MNLISGSELKGKMDRGEKFQLVMVLNEWAFRAKHIPGSINIHSEGEGLAKLNPEDDIVIYCSNDSCIASRAAYQILINKGFTKVRRYAGGLNDWEISGYPLEGEMTG